MSEERKKADLSENARPFRRLQERVRSPVARRGRSERDAVDRSQWAVNESIVGGKQVAIVPPLADQQVDGGLESLFLGAIGDRLVELGIDRRILDQVLNSIE